MLNPGNIYILKIIRINVTSINTPLTLNFKKSDNMNEIGQLQLIWIRRLASETERIRTLNDCDELTRHDLNRYIKKISEMDDFCKNIIESKNWNLNNITSSIEEVENELFVHFYEVLEDSYILENII